MSVVNMAVIREDSFIDTKVELWNKRKTRKGMGKEHFLSNTLIFIQISLEKKHLMRSLLRPLENIFILWFSTNQFFYDYYLTFKEDSMNWIDILLEVEGIK